MLRSKFDKKGNFRANKVFTDRTDPRILFKDTMNNFYTQTLKSKIIVYYGIGGIGKSKLINELNKPEYYKDDLSYKVKKIHISLDVYDYSNPVTILINIRKQLMEDCPLFDYALFTYFNKIGATASEALKKFKQLNTTIIDIIEDVVSVGLGDVTVPIKYLKILTNKIHEKVKSMKIKELVEELTNLSEFEIYERLPYYLGLEIRRLNMQGNRIVLFLDAYESISIKMNNSAACEEKDEWLKELFLSSENLLIIIGSREKLRWEEQDLEWGNYLDQHILSRLSDKDARYFLEKVPVNEEEVIESIVLTAKGIPIYLDMCVDLYEYNQNNNIPNSKEYFKIETGKIIDRYLRHLSGDEKYATEVLALLDLYDMNLVKHLLKDLNISMNQNDLKNYLTKSMFIELDNNMELYKLDDSVKNHIKAQSSNTLIAYVVKSLQTYLKEIIDVSNEKYLKYFEQLIKPFGEHKWDLSICEITIDIINNIIDYGNWNELDIIINNNLNALLQYNSEIYYYSKLRFYRRRGKLAEGCKLIESARFDEKLLGKHEYFYRFLKVHFMHLKGNYDCAIKKYREELEKYKLIKRIVNEDAFYMFKIKYADLLMLKGQFKSSLEIIESILDVPQLSENIIVEALRVKGHILRFNYQFKEAETIYEGILSICGEKNLNAIGKVYNNILECKCFNEPEEAIKIGLRSIEVNKNIGASIEVGKTYASLGIAYALCGDKENSYNAINSSYSIQIETGYQSGVLFSLIAKYLSKMKFGFECNAEKEELYQEIFELNKKLNVYDFLLNTVNEQDDDCNHGFEWLDYNLYKERLKVFLGLLGV